MKHLFTFLCWIVPILGVFIACSKKPKPSPYHPHQYEEASEEMLALGKDTMDPNEALLDLEAPTWTIFFSFDSYALAEAHKAAALGKYLQITGRKAFLAGHASEEGTTEYNLALGAQRAVTVRNYLDAFGISEDRIAWQSYGEERPVTHDPEKAHLNRRVEITIERKIP